MQESLHINLKAKLEELVKVKQAFKSFYQWHELSPEVTFALDLAVEELMVNTINHASTSVKEISILVSLEKQLEAIILTIIDDAPRFNPLEVENPDLASTLMERPVGGLGIYLSRQLVDDFQYNYQSKQNRVVIKKNIN